MREFVVFVVHIYSSWWACCASSVNAPVLDLNLYKAILRYKSVNESVSESAKKAVEHHLWYLTPELCFFFLSVCENVSDCEKKLSQFKVARNKRSRRHRKNV